MITRLRRFRLPALLLIALVQNAPAAACPSCYGASDSPLTQGMNTAILVMLAITGSVLALFIAFFTVLWKRARALKPVSSAERTVINEKGILRWNNT